MTTLNNTALLESTIQRRGGIVVLPLSKWKKIEESLEDLEMYRSESLAGIIEARRQGEKTVPLTKLLQKYRN